MSTKASRKSSNQWIALEKKNGALVPYAPHDVVMLERLPEGVPLRGQFARPRNAGRHRLYWVILRIVVENTDRYATEEALHKALLLTCGVTEPILSAHGEIFFIPSSTSFDAMPESEFKAYFDEAMGLITTVIIPGLDLDELLKEARAQSRFSEAA